MLKQVQHDDEDRGTSSICHNPAFEGRMGKPVSYTHLDVYKRQRRDCALTGRRLSLIHI
ncbi:hypothetical protein [Sphingobium sp. B2]|uniref:hypothetical protein n=1 Tax=Sphingobium sp. B2 TaxID=2583228 RepID=UPI001643F19F|nr:hypothetical protein [Sphingobium sp. B2]